jgi:NADPH:quinone reductase-like Zn-dependent oxidoreductase
LLIQGASSGVGLMGMQIGKLMGASTVMGGSTNRSTACAAERVRLRPADRHHPIRRWPEEVKKATGGKGVDVIVDMVSAPVANQNLEAACVLGRIVNVGRLGGQKGEFNFDLHATQAHRLYRRYLPHPLARGGARDRETDARRPVAGGRSRQAVAADRTRPSRWRKWPKRWRS